MRIITFISTRYPIAYHTGTLSLLAIPIAAITGTLAALFLFLLEHVTSYRHQHPWLLYLLPLAGLLIYLIYHRWGRTSAAGNNLLISEVHQPTHSVPARMAPLVLLTTLITHLFGGSAGREGTAVQMGGSIAAKLTRWFRLSHTHTSSCILMGIAAGFGAVFGTPITGAVFALEVVAIGQIRYKALLPCLLSALMAHAVCTAWGITHTHYPISTPATIPTGTTWPQIRIMALAALSGIAFGRAAHLFSATTHTIQQVTHRLFSRTPWLTPIIGGLLIIIITLLLGNTYYLGLGVSSPTPHGVSIVSAFSPGHIAHFSWLIKLLLTAITLGTGFKGGEVTPLFFIGATLGHTIATILGAPIQLFAALGFIAVFAGAANTPLACTLMGIELFGATYAPYYAIACFTAYYASAHSGIYAAQRLALSKHH